MDVQCSLLISLLMPGRSYPGSLGLKLAYYCTGWLNLTIKGQISPQIRVNSSQASLCFLSKAFLDHFQAAICFVEAVVFCPGARLFHAIRIIVSHMSSISGGARTMIASLRCCDIRSPSAVGPAMIPGTSRESGQRQDHAIMPV
jgi:hypothetical protein